MTAEALKTITRPVKTSSMVAVKSHRSTFTRLAMASHFTTETQRQGGIWWWKIGWGMTGLVRGAVSSAAVRARTPAKRLLGVSLQVQRIGVIKIRV